MTMVVYPLADSHVDDVLTICQNLRTKDRMEIFATRFDSEPEDLLVSTMALTDTSWIAYDGDVPVAVFGIMPIAPNVWSAYAFATDRFPRIALSLTRFIKRGIIPSLLATGAKQVQAMVWTEYHQARKWLSGFGAREEAVIPNLGKNGEDFALTIWRP
jgi:hypothetical protein